MGTSDLILASGAVVLGTLALTETFWLLPAGAAAYAAAWWVLGLERHAPGHAPGAEDPR